MRIAERDVLEAEPPLQLHIVRVGLLRHRVRREVGHLGRRVEQLLHSLESTIASCTIR